MSELETVSWNTIEVILFWFYGRESNDIKVFAGSE
jgi:hypothetical protein